MMKRAIFFLFFFVDTWASVIPGVDVFFSEGHFNPLKEKRVALVTNHTGVNLEMRSTIDLLREKVDLVAVFAPEHGLKGQQYAWEKVGSGESKGIVIHSLHGETRRPTSDMLKNIDVIIYDIQCTGVRAYTYETTLFYVMEEAVKYGIEVIVLDRPNPMNGVIVDGPMLEEKWRSFIGYVNVPYCHGMTIGELACLFNEEYKIGCNLKVIEMKGWKREMSYRATGLAWIPPSPNIPEPDTPLYCPATGILGELSVLSIGIGFTLPFKIVGAPWIEAESFAEKLNQQKLPGVRFQPFHFRPFSGLYQGVDCQGVMIHIIDPKIYKPLSVQFMLLGLTKTLYPKEFAKRCTSQSKRDLFSKANGTDVVYEILMNEKYPAWKLIEIHKEERDAFLEIRKKYLMY